MPLTGKTVSEMMYDVLNGTLNLTNCSYHDPIETLPVVNDIFNWFLFRAGALTMEYVDDKLIDLANEGRVCFKPWHYLQSLGHRPVFSIKLYLGLLFPFSSILALYKSDYYYYYYYY